MSAKYYHPDHDWFRKRNLTVPSATPHDVVDEELESKQVKLNPSNWRQEGNQLIADTEMGRLVQFIPTDKILVGTDENGNPVLQNVKV